MGAIAKACGGRCPSTGYLGNRLKLTWECQLGYVWSSMPGTVVKRGAWLRVDAMITTGKVIASAVANGRIDRVVGAHTRFEAVLSAYFLNRFAIAAMIYRSWIFQC